MAESMDNRTPLVSITSAFYNTGPPLLDMVRSIMAQTLDDWELVLLDDGSTDNSLELAHSIRDRRIRVFSNGRNLGRAASLNKLTTLARGRYIARMDSDDMSATPRIERQVEYLEAHAKTDVVGTGILYIDRGGEPVGFRSVPPDHDAICRHPSRMFNICHGSILTRRGWLERFKYDEALPLAVDSNLFLRAYNESTFGNVTDPLYYYRYEPSFTLRKQWATRRASATYLFGHHRRAGHWGRAVFHWGTQHAKFGVIALSLSAGLRQRLLTSRV